MTGDASVYSTNGTRSTGEVRRAGTRYELRPHRLKQTQKTFLLISCSVTSAQGLPTWGKPKPLLSPSLSAPYASVSGVQVWVSVSVAHS